MGIRRNCYWQIVDGILRAWNKPGFDYFFNPGENGGLPRGTPSYFMQENKITEQIIGGAIQVHRALGPGLPESAYYMACLCDELRKRALLVEKEKPVPLVYEEVKIW